MSASRISRAITALSLRYRVAPSNTQSTRARADSRQLTSRSSSRAPARRPVAHTVSPKRETKEASIVVDQRIRFRLALALGVFMIVFVLILGRTLMLQTFSRDTLHAASIDQRTRTVTLRADRGGIFDRNGHEIALSVPSQTLFVDPRMVVDPIGTAHALAGLLQLTPEREAKIQQVLVDKKSSFLYLARQVDKSTAQAVLALGLPGVSSDEEPLRVVESGVAGAVIGRTDPDGVGTAGLELQYDKLLAGIDGVSVRELDGSGNSMSNAAGSTNSGKPGDDLVLTIDKSLQFQTDQALIQRVTQLSAKAGTVIMMNSRTGEIYAMSNVRRSLDGTVGLATGNFAAVEAHEPGSVAKVFSVSAALDLGRTTETSSYKVPGTLRMDKFTIRDAYPHGLVSMTTRDIVRESSNLGAVKISETVTLEEKHDYLRAFGFGEKTGLQYPGESRGILRPTKDWYGTQKITVDYGYGYATTPLQMLAGVNVVANGGTYVAPKLLKATIDEDGVIHEAALSATHQVLKESTATTMTSLLKEVVCAGTGKLAQVKGMKVAGKTGTGYKAQTNGTYTTNTGGRKYFASFVGYFPADDPQITMLVSIDEPNGNTHDRFGGTAAATVFSRLAEVAIHELQISPTGVGSGCPKRSAVASSH
ncbi:MAG: penicillin-binding protein 2 [Ilumatobacteraceae bacterium]|nr:penicillin-binding protein 2 [Ilumatobacteraceae bacterium]